MNRLLILFAIFFSPLVCAQDIVAIMDLKFVKETEDVAAWMCYGEDNDECSPWAYFYVFDAKVKDVISGELGKKRIRVIFGRHALKTGSHKNVVVTLSKLEEGKEAEYQILEWGSKEELYCFNPSENKKYNVRIESSGIELKCYKKETAF